MDADQPTSSATRTPPASTPRDSRRAGGEADFEALFRDSRDDLFAYLAYLLADRSLAEEVTALTFERAFRKRRSYRSERGELRAWLFRIARNAAIDELRRAKRERALTFDAAANEAAPDAGATALDRAMVAAALRRLDPAARELVALKFFGGLTNVEIARVVGRSDSAVGTRLHRAVSRLREDLDA